MTATGTSDPAAVLPPAEAWSRRVRRFRPVGWTLTVAPFVLVAVLSGSTLAAVTGLGAAREYPR